MPSIGLDPTCILIIADAIASIVNVTSGRTIEQQRGTTGYAQAEDLSMHSNVFVALPTRSEMCTYIVQASTLLRLAKYLCNAHALAVLLIIHVDIRMYKSVCMVPTHAWLLANRTV